MYSVKEFELKRSSCIILISILYTQSTEKEDAQMHIFLYSSIVLRLFSFFFHSKVFGLLRLLPIILCVGYLVDLIIPSSS